MLWCLPVINFLPGVYHIIPLYICPTCWTCWIWIGVLRTSERTPWCYFIFYSEDLIDETWNLQIVLILKQRLGYNKFIAVVVKDVKWFLKVFDVFSRHDKIHCFFMFLRIFFKIGNVHGQKPCNASSKKCIALLAKSVKD